MAIKNQLLLKIMKLLQFNIQTKWRARKVRKAQFKLINDSVLFDLKFFIKTSGIDFNNRRRAIKHYLKFGTEKGHNPSLYFNTTWYLKQNPDVKKTGINPLAHYLSYGWLESRSPRPAMLTPELEYIDQLFFEGQLKNALQFIQRLEPDDALNVELWLRKARILFYLNQYQSCLDCIQQLLSYPRQIFCPQQYQDFCEITCKILCAQNRLDEARKYIFQAYYPVSHWQPEAASMMRETIKSTEDLIFYKNLLNPHLQQGDKISCQALLQWSLAARDTGDYETAIAAVRERFLQGVTKVHSFGSEKKLPQNPAYWQQAAKVALLNLKEDLDSQQIPFFLISGTLLGCIREQQILAHDKDIDVGVMNDISPASLQSAIKASGRFCIMHGMHEKIVQIKHANGVHINIFVHWQEKDKIFHCGRKTSWVNQAFNLMPYSFLGTQFQVPENYDQYLTENYGNWRLPAIDFETFADTPNMIVTHQAELLWYYYKNLLDHYKFGNKRMYQKIWSIFNSIKPADHDEQNAFNDSMERAV